MPKSKRDRTIALTQTKKKGLEFKQSLISEIRDCCDQYENLFIISIFNQRNNYLKELRHEWTHSKFIFGKNKVMSLAFGRSTESEYKDNLHKLCPYLVGEVGLLFTNKSKDEVLKFFNEYTCPDFARSGCIATEDLLISAGPLEQFQHTMEPELRKLGMHTSLKKGIVTLDVDYQICKKGDKLSPDQARLLKLFDTMQAEFKVNMRAYWNKNGDFEAFQKIEIDQNNNNNNNDNDDSSNADDVEANTEEIDEIQVPKKKSKK